MFAEIGKHGEPMLVSASAYENEGFNAIPAALAKLFNNRLGNPFARTVVQTNIRQPPQALTAMVDSLGKLHLKAWLRRTRIRDGR